MRQVYSTKRLILKTLTPLDASMVVDYYNRNRSFLEPFEPTREDYFFTTAHQARILTVEEQEMEAGRMLRLWIVRKDQPDQVIGTLAFSNIVRGIFQSCHLGYKSDCENLNQGYMTEALKEAIKIAFKELNLHRIEANIMPRNAPSLRVVEKLGFKEEGLAKEYLKINDIWEDHIHMTLLNPQPM